MTVAAEEAPPRDATLRRARWCDHEIVVDFLHAPVAMVSAAVLIACVLCATFAPWLAPHDPFDLASLDLADAHLPPAWLPDGRRAYPLGTDEQGRDLLSALMYGARTSLAIGGLSVMLSLAIGVTAGLVAGHAGGIVDAAIMRLCDVMLSFPAILVALLLDGIGRVVLHPTSEWSPFVVLVLALGLTDWVRYARTVRGATMIETRKDYVQAARLMGVAPGRLLCRHVLPNVMGPIRVLATLQFAQAILAEATLSYLGVGAPPTRPSLGTLVRNGYDFLYAGEWWITVAPGLALLVIALSINLIGDWLRDAFDPRLR